MLQPLQFIWSHSIFEPQSCSEIELSGFNALSQPFFDEDSEDPKQSQFFFNNTAPSLKGPFWISGAESTRM